MLRGWGAGETGSSYYCLWPWEEEGNRGSGHVGDKKSQAEGMGRFTMRVVSTAPVGTGGAAEKAAVPHPPPPLPRVGTGHPPRPPTCRATPRLSGITTNTQSNKTPTKGHKHLERRPPWSETNSETKILLSRSPLLIHKHAPHPHSTLTCSLTVPQAPLQSQKHRGNSTIHCPPESQKHTEPWTRTHQLHTHTKRKCHPSYPAPQARCLWPP